jgi:hypothetical protein
MDPHVAEVVTEPLLHGLAGWLIQRPAVRPQYVVHDRRNALGRLARRTALQFLLLLALRAFPFRPRLFSATAFALQPQPAQRRKA